MDVRYVRKVEVFLDALDPHIRERIIEKILFFSRQPDPRIFAERMTGVPCYRFRVGDHRVIFELLDNTLVILLIKPRDKVYRNL